ncbi:MAG: ribonuclease HII [Candidatus Pacebacteria bacterium]|nr:ribonuclease HII [Candidatus Paceibacterota bacterium]
MRYIVGVDEAGRGPLAGPVAVGVAMVAEGYDVLASFPGLNDSKKLSEKKRDALYAVLIQEVKAGNLRVKVCLSGEKMIDDKGIAYAVRDALARGVKSLMPDPSSGKIYLDGSLSAPKEYEQETIIGGDGKIPAIMLAALAAKVTRDRLMTKLALDYPAYGFEGHKGYGTKAHLEAIRMHGVSPVHRKTFIHIDREPRRA